MKYLILLLLALALLGCSTETPQVVKTESEPKINQKTVLPDTFTGTAFLTNSTMTWKGSKLAGSSHTGTIQIQNGHIFIEDSIPKTGMFIIDMTTIKDNDGLTKLESHLKNKDFFDVINHPTSTFKITKFETINGDYHVTGNLTILGITNSISFPTNTIVSIDKVTVKAAFSIDRTRWNITYGSGSFFDNLGDRAIDDRIFYNIYLVFKPEFKQ